jgi:hypothetical protein
MKKVIIAFCLFLLPFAFVSAQTEVDTIQTEVDTACMRNLENIFKIFVLRDNYETLRYVMNKNPSLSRKIRFEKSDSIPAEKFGESKEIRRWSEEESKRQIEQFNYRPFDARKEYSDFIRNMILEKEFYMECVDAELAKGDESEYAEARLHYDFMEPMMSVMTPWITKSDFLKVFKEFILNDGELFLPDYFRVKAYLECGCKLPPYWSFYSDAKGYRIGMPIPIFDSLLRVCCLYCFQKGVTKTYP